MQITLNSQWNITLVCSPDRMEKDKERRVQKFPPGISLPAFNCSQPVKSMHASVLMS